MIIKIYLCYLFSFNRGSEWQLGENVLLKIKNREYIVCAAHQLADKSSGNINGIPYFRVDGKICVVGLPSSKKNQIQILALDWTT